ncbi:MAG: Poly(3-hydroxyalkanoate) synthetase [Frankiales bacterium]|jgi:polyhydroxyalkanoate synthase|nr:Poly(3-hydroxyalkanoate) synthetase [Frankiales bacterium]
MGAGAVLRAPGEVLNRVRRDVERNALRARNGIKIVAGAGRPAAGLTPKDVVWQKDRATMWRYRSDHVRHAPPLLIVFSLVSKSYVLDLTPGNSFVEHLRDDGFDVFLLDWGTPDERDASNGLEDYAERYIPAAVDAVREASGSPDVSLLGYCFGGVLALLAVAAKPELPLASLTTVATPVDYQGSWALTEALARGDLKVGEVLDDAGNVPPSVLYQYFKLIAPTQELSQYANLLDNLWDDALVEAHQRMAGWAKDHVPFPGRAAQQSVDMLIRDNALMTGRLRLGNRQVSLADIRTPYLNVVATRDNIVPPSASLPAFELVGSADKQQLLLDAGHIGQVVGRTAHRTSIPAISDFLRRRSRPVPLEQP